MTEITYKLNLIDGVSMNPIIRKQKQKSIKVLFYSSSSKMNDFYEEKKSAKSQGGYKLYGVCK